jgi:recombinational DNA repair ATPase RecF
MAQENRLIMSMLRVATGVHYHHNHHLLNWVWPVLLMDEIAIRIGSDVKT